MSIKIRIGRITVGLGTSGGGGWTPQIPTGLTGTIITSSRIDLAGTYSGTDEDGLSWEQSTDGINYTVLGTTANGVRAYSVTSGLSIGSTYLFRFRAYKGAKYSAYSNVVIKTITSLNTGLIAYYNLNDVNDSVGTRHLTNNNSATFVSGVIGNAVSLGTGNTNKSLSRDDNYGLTYSSPKSVVGWFVLNDAIAVGSMYSIFTWMFAANPGNYVTLLYSRTAENYILSTNTGTSYLFPGGLTVGVKYHFAVTWDHAGNKVKLYFNGGYRFTDIVFEGNYSAQTNHFAIGKLITSYFASVKVDEVGLYNRLLTEIEITDSYNIGLGVTAPFDTIVNSVVYPESAYCWFARPRATYDASVNKSFIGVHHNDGTGYTHHVLTMDNNTTVATSAKVGTVYEADDHDEPTLLVRASDSKLFICYAEHSGTVIRYRISTNPLDASAWGDEVTINPNPGKFYTYPSCFEVSNGDIYIFFRENDAGIPWWCYVKSVDGGATFGAEVRFSNKTYHNIIQNLTNKDIIHFAAVQHPLDAVDPNQVIHYYFNAGTGTWHKSDGTDITSVIPVDDVDATVIMTQAAPEQAWIEDIFLDSNGYPRVLMTYYPDAVTTPEHKYLYYSEWNGSAWSVPYEIHESLNRNIASTNSALEICYPPLACFDRGNANRIFASKDVSGITEIFEITRVAANNFTSVQKTTGSYYNQWRPFTVESPNNNVYWLNQVKYASYKGAGNFNQQLKCKTL